MLVCERRDRLGGAATLERPFADQRFVVSPCAYLVGLLDEVVIYELELERHGYEVTPADPNLWCPFDDGSSYGSFIDSARTTEYLRSQGFADADIRGARASSATSSTGSATCCAAGADGDSWPGPSPDRAEIERLLGDDPELIGDRLRGVDRLDARALRRRPAAASTRSCARARSAPSPGPRDPGTAAVRLMHHQGDLLGLGSYWGYVAGRARPRVVRDRRRGARGRGDPGSRVCPSPRSIPGEGVELESGERISAPVVICNADPKRLLALLDAGDAETCRRTTARASRTGTCARR